MVQVERIGRVSSDWFSLPVDKRFLSGVRCAFAAYRLRVRARLQMILAPTLSGVEAREREPGVRIAPQAVRAAEKGRTR